MSHAVRLPCDEASIRTGVADPACQTAGRWVLAATILGSSLSFIDGTVVTVALPAIGREMVAGGADLQWVVESYALFLSALLLVGGSLADQFGRRRVYALGVLLFAGASIVCGLAPTIGSLIAARAIQGIGAALLVPGSLALISASFDPSSRGRAIGTWSGFSGITTAIGPLLGGWLVNHSWRWAFFINVPIATIVLLLLRRVPESRSPEARHVDVPGAALATLGLGGMVFGLIESPRRGWGDPMVIAGMVLGVVCLALFLFVEARSKSPMLPLSLFRSPSFAGANALTLFLYGALAAVFFFLPLNLIEVQGYSPLGAGAALLPFIVILFLLSRWSGGLVERMGARLPLIVGPLVAAVGFFLLSLPETGRTYLVSFFPGILVLGLGMAVSIAPLTTTVMNAVDRESAGIASGVNNAASRVAGLLAIALFGMMLSARFGAELQHRVAEIPLDAAARQEVLAQRGLLGAARPPAGVSPEQALRIRGAIDRSFVSGFSELTRVSAGLSILAAACAALWIDQPRGRQRRRASQSSRLGM
ncbi:MAG TPA: MFS transporter [Candidatus Eisenbacteria bacterium]|nr:MFS transporter [Candidatus Eisenbacteria bacterium]